MKDALHAYKLPNAVREAFNARKFADVVLYPAPTNSNDDDDAHSGCVRCNSSALAAASPLMRRLLGAADPAQGSLCLSLDCSLSTLRQLAMFAHRGATDMMDKGGEEEFRQWATILEVGTTFLLF